LAEHIDDVEGARIVAGADISEPARDAFASARPAAFVCEDYRALLARTDVDAVFITTPDFLHEEQAVAALAAGKAVYLEKPIAITTEGADRILHAARDSGAKLFLGHNMRYFPAVLKMKEIIDAGRIGAVQAVWCRHFVGIGGDAYFRDWHSQRRNSTGLLLQKGAHDIDVIHWLAGAHSTAVVAMGRLSVYDKARRRSSGQPENANIDSRRWPPLEQDDFSPTIDVEDHSMMLMELANGVQASYLQCHYTPDYWRNYTFIGTRGRLENFGISGSCEIRVFTSRCGGTCEPDEIHYLEPTAGGHGGSDPSIVRAFVRFVRDDVAPSTSPVAARHAVAAGVAATQSLRDGSNRVSVPPLPANLTRYFELDNQQH
jgi:predicted dehydrogenase